MQHHFSVEIATVYGVYEAVIYENLYYWIKKNEVNNKHFYDNNTWTYNSIRAFSDLFPYLTSKKISNALKNLEDEGIIITGNYNQIKYDQTKWYALTEKGKSIYPKSQMDTTQKEIGISEKGEPIPDNKPFINPNKKQMKEANAHNKKVVDLTLPPELRVAEYQKITPSRLKIENYSGGKHQLNNVYLTDDEYEKLKAEFRSSTNIQSNKELTEIVEHGIDILDNYIELCKTEGKGNGLYYKNHYLVLRGWVKNEAIKRYKASKCYGKK